MNTSLKLNSPLLKYLRVCTTITPQPCILIGGIIAYIMIFCAFTFAATGDTGIASKYSGDMGIEKDPSVIFTENFEEPTVDSLTKRWEDYDVTNVSFTTDKPSVSRGAHSLLSSGGSGLYRRIQPGYDQVYVRFYAKFDPGCTEVHHWFWMGGQNPSLSYAYPHAGYAPPGNLRWSSGIEPNGTAWTWDFYTYWKDMRANPTTNFTTGYGFWGNAFNGGVSGLNVNKGQWICIEFMVKMNTPVDSYNGEQAFWINGVKKSHLGLGFPKGTWIWDGFHPDSSGQPFEGFQWRTESALNINYIWLEHYVDTDPTCGCWFDDLVAAKNYIGPINSGSVSIKGPLPSGYNDPLSKVQRQSAILYNCYGQKLRTIAYTPSGNARFSKTDLRNEHLPPGSYFVKLENNALNKMVLH